MTKKQHYLYYKLAEFLTSLKVVDHQTTQDIWEDYFFSGGNYN